MQRQACCLAVCALLCAGCPDDETNGNVLGGELGAGKFTYLCLDDSDAQCDENEEVSSLALASIATGGHFGISYDLSNVLTTSSKDRLDYDFDLERWIAKKPGWVAILGTGDFAHFRIVDPAALAISRREASGSFTGSFGGISVSVEVELPTHLRVAPVGDDDAVLAGALPCTWTSSDPTIAEIVGDPEDNVVEVVGHAAGSADITVELGELTATTTIDVGGG